MQKEISRALSRQEGVASGNRSSGPAARSSTTSPPGRIPGVRGRNPPQTESMRRALFSLCAALGLLLGCCSQPREIRAAELERVVNELPGTESARRAGAWAGNPAYPVEQRTAVGYRRAAR